MLVHHPLPETEEVKRRATPDERQQQVCRDEVARIKASGDVHVNGWTRREWLARRLSEPKRTKGAVSPVVYPVVTPQVAMVYQTEDVVTARYDINGRPVGIANVRPQLIDRWQTECAARRREGVLL